MLWLDALLRISTVTLLLLSAILALRDKCCWRPAIFVVLTALGTAGMLIATAPEVLRPPFPLFVIASLLEAGAIVFAWWFGLAIFRDDFKLKWSHWAIFFAFITLTLPRSYAQIFESYTYPAFLLIAFYVFSLALMGHLVFTVTREGRDDLVATRRLYRAYFIGGVVASVTFSILTENVWNPFYEGQLTFIKPLVVFPLALWFTLWLTRIDLDSMEFQHSPGDLSEGGSAIDPRDEFLLQKLTAAMETDKIYREAGMTIRSLAEHLDAPEHRLRALINQGLGYRNFSAFVNSYRINAVKADLQDPEKSRIPVLTLAMDVGYNSLAPFNRAFRAMEGMTPTAYRQKLNEQKGP
jgi:AraC-like DNA-binding protein